MKRLKKILGFLVHVEPTIYAYTVHIADRLGGLSSVIVKASNQYEADQVAKGFEKDGVHVVSVERVY